MKVGRIRTSVECELLSESTSRKAKPGVGSTRLLRFLSDPKHGGVCAWAQGAFWSALSECKVRGSCRKVRRKAFHAVSEGRGKQQEAIGSQGKTAMGDVYDLYPQWVTKQAMAERLGVSERTVYAMWQRGELLRKEEGRKVLWSCLPEEGRKGSQEATRSISSDGTEEDAGRQRKEASRGRPNGLVSSQDYLFSQLEKERERVVELQVDLAKTKVALACVETERDFLRKVVQSRPPTILQLFKRLVDGLKARFCWKA